MPAPLKPKVINGTDKSDSLLGSSGADQITLKLGNDTVAAGDGNDTIIGGPGNDSIDGGNGTDQVSFTGPISNYNFVWLSGGVLQITDAVLTDGDDGIDKVKNVEKLQFGSTVIDMATAAPLTHNDSYSGGENDTLTMDALANDFSLRGPGTLTYLKFGSTATVAATGDKVGEVTIDGQTFDVTLDATNKLTLALGTALDGMAAGEVANTSFQVTVGNGSGNTSSETISLQISGSNDAPTGGNDSFVLDQDDTLTIALADSVLNNDNDAEGQALTAVLEDGPSHGSLTFNADGTFEYTPDAGYTGTDDFTYRASDGSATSDPITVSLTVNATGETYRGYDNAYNYHTSPSPGDDTLVGGDETSYYAYNYLDSNDGNDSLQGGSAFGGTIENQLHGGSGNDTMVGGTPDGGYVYNYFYLDTGDDSAVGASGLNGGWASNYFYDGGGQDTLVGGATNAYNYFSIDGLDTGDSVQGGVFGDYLYGVIKDDADHTLAWSNGTVTLDGIEVASSIEGLQAFMGIGDDTVTSDNPNGYLYGGNGNDSLQGAQVYGEAGNDTLQGSSTYNWNYLEGGDGNDSMVGSTFGQNSFNGMAGDDTAIGGSYYDYFQAGSGNDSFDGGDGYDTLNVYGVNTMSLTDGTLVTSDGTTSFSGVERFYVSGTYGDDSLDASGLSAASYVTIESTLGNDTLLGSDTFQTTFVLSDLGGDSVVGGTGTSDQVMINNVDSLAFQSNGDGSFDLNGSEVRGVEILYVNNSSSVTIGDTSGSGLDMIYVYANYWGATTVNAAEATANIYAYLYNYYNYSNSLVTGSGNDTVYGSYGTDVLNTGAGNDYIYMYYDYSSDYLTFDQGSGNDSVYGFNAYGVLETVNVADYGFTDETFADVLANATEANGNTTLHLDANDSITFLSLNKSSLTADQFILA